MVEASVNFTQGRIPLYSRPGSEIQDYLPACCFTWPLPITFRKGPTIVLCSIKAWVTYTTQPKQQYRSYKQWDCFSSDTPLFLISLSEPWKEVVSSAWVTSLNLYKPPKFYLREVMNLTQGEILALHIQVILAPGELYRISQSCMPHTGWL